MTTNETADQERTDIADRTLRALTQYLTVTQEGPDLYEVTSESGKAYIVDVRDDHCTCPDHEYRDATCKHLRRVMFETGRARIPEAFDRDELPEDFGQHIDNDPDGGAAAAVVTDGGTLLEPEDDGETCLCEIDPDGPGCFEHYNGGED